MKRILSILLMVTLMITVTACGERNKGENGNSISNQESQMPADLVEQFFSAFEKSDYETMKTYCTKECVDSFFHDGDVFGIVWAKATQIEEEPQGDDKNEAKVFVDVDIKSAEVSSFSVNDTQTSFYVVLKMEDNESWAIDSFVTG